MRIAVVSNTAWYLCNFRLNLMRALQSAGHTVVAVAPMDGYVCQIQAAGFEFESVAISGGGTNPLIEMQSVVGLWCVLRRQRIDLVLSYTPKGNLYSALACLVLGVAFLPNVSGLGRAFIRKSVITSVAQTLYKLTFSRAKHVFFQNNDDLKVFVDLKLVSPERAERIPGSGVDLSRFEPVSLPSIGDRGPVFLLVARMMWDKGVGEYVEAARAVKMVYPNSRFQLLGFVDVANPSAISREQIQEWVDKDVVEYLGPTDDVRPWLAQSDCVVLPSYREGVPRTLLEAAAMGRAVIATDAPGCRDTLIDRKTGFLCCPADARSLADSILLFIKLSVDERIAMGLSGRAFVEKHFDEKLVLQRYLDVVGDICAVIRQA